MKENLSESSGKSWKSCWISHISKRIAEIFCKKKSPKESKLGKLYNKAQISSLIERFPENLEEDITTWISERLLEVLQKQKNSIAIDRILEAKEDSEKKEHLIEELVQNPEELESLLLYIYNRNFWNTHIKDWNKLKDLKIHYPWEAKQEWLDIGKRWNYWQAEEPITSCWRKLNTVIKEFFWIGIQDIMEIYYKPHLLKMDEKEEAMIEEILVWLERGEKSFIILNHDTFANIPLAILKFMKKAEELGIKNVNRFFTTIIWPLLNTHKLQNTVINSLSNVVITHPTGNIIPEAKPLISLQQKNALIQILNDLKKWGEGQVYFCSPSGTRDVVIYWKDEADNPTSFIYLPDETWWSNISTINLINKLKKNNPELKIYAFSTNTTALKQGISPNDNTRNKHADILMHIQELNQEEPLSPDDVTLTLVKWIKKPIRNKNWDVIDEKPNALLVPDFVFKKLKQRSKVWSFPKGLFEKDGSLKTDNLEWIFNQEKEF